MALDLLLDEKRPAGRRAATASALPAASGVDLEDLTVYRGRATLLSHLHLAIRPGEIFALVGPAGSGKSAALHAVAGTVRPGIGRVKIGDRDVTDRRAGSRGVALVTRDPALSPRLRVDENVALGLRSLRLPRVVARDRIEESLHLVGMQDHLHRTPGALSASQQLLVALARAVASQPQVLVLDQPLAALDHSVRRDLLDEVRLIHRARPGLTMLYAAADPAEALTLADRIAVLREGRLVSFGPAQDLYRRPPNRFTAEFLGRANLLEVTIESHASDSLVKARFGESELLVRDHPTLGRGNRCLLCIRPHDLSLGSPMGATNTLRGTVRAAVWQGEQQQITLDLAGTILRAITAPMSAPPAPGTVLDLHFQPAQGVLIPAELSH